MFKDSFKVVVLALMVLWSFMASAQTVTQNFSYTGAMQTWIVPPGVLSIDVDIRGAQGGAAYSGGVGGSGGRIQATLSVTPGQTLNIFVGGTGETAGGALPISGGFNGGGDGGAVSAGTGGGGGGGASDIRIGGTALANRVLVAGGGGAAGHDGSPTNGGAGGGLVGGTAANGNNGATVEATGGSQVAGGTEGSLSGFGSGFPGSFGQGGNAGTYYAGGGGGGYYGGGGGMWAGGGGGSSYADGGLATGVIHSQNFQAGNGELLITYQQCVLPTIPAVFVTNPLSRLHTLTNVNLAGSGSNATFVDPGQTVTLSFDYNIVSGGAGCPGCVTQTYVGIKDEWGACVSSYGGYCNCSGTYSNSFTAPTTPGVYYFTLGASWLFNCGTPNAYIPNPNGSNEFGAIVVRESFSTNVTDESCVGDNDGQIAVTNVFGTTGTSYQWSTGATTPTISSLSAGTYTVTSSDSYGCYQIDTLEVFTDTTAPQAFAESSVSLFLNSSGITSVNTAAIDSASSDDCSFNMRIGEPILNGLESNYTFLGNYNGHSYYISKQADTRANGNTMAQAAGGYLATINDALENNFLQPLLPTEFPFIGYNDIALEGTFVWENGSLSAYTNWSGFEPSNTGNEDCVQMYYTTGLWNDIPCTNLYPHLLEVEDTVAFSNTLNFDCSDTTSFNVILEVVDQGGLISYDTSVVNVIDGLSPNIITQNITIYLDSNGNASIAADSVDNGTSDNCALDSISLSQTDFDCSHIGTNNLTFTAVDSNGNVSTMGVVVTVQDTLAPILLTNSVEIFLDVTGNATILPDTLDAGTWDSCGIASTSLSQTSFGCADVGLNRVWFSATDINGNTDSALVNVLVNDTTPFQLSCISDTTIYTPFDSCSKEFGYDIASNAACGDSFTLDSGLASGSAFPLGLTSVGISKAELAGEQVLYDFNSLSLGSIHTQDNWSVTGTVSSLSPQVVDLQADNGFAASRGVNQPAIGGSNSIWLTRINDGSWSLLPFDSNDVISIELDINRNFWGNRIGIGYDINNDGNIANNEFIAGIWSADNPGVLQIHGPNATSLASEAVGSSDWMKVKLEIDLKSKLASLSYQDLETNGPWTSPAALQNVAIGFDYSALNNTNPLLADGFVYFHEAGGPSQFDNFIFSVRERENCTFNVTVEDTIPPAIITQNITVALDSLGSATITADSLDNGTTDNCTLDSIGIDITSFSCADVGSPVQVVFTAVDSVGNSDTNNVTVTVIDNIGPAVLTQNLTVYLDSTGNTMITSAMIDNGSWDSCGIDSIYLSQYAFNCSDTGINTVTLFADDINGNTSSATATVEIFDTIAPVVNSHNDTVYLGANGQATITPTFIDDASWDSCNVALSLDINSFSCADVGTPVLVTLTGTDPSGNSDTSSSTITVLDTVSPVVITQPLTVYLDAAGTASITSASVNNGSWDSCGIANLFLNDSVFDCSDVGASFNIILTANDINGNSDTAHASITVEDTISPTAVAQNLLIYLDSFGSATIDADSVNNGSSDVCGLASLSLNDSIFDCSDVGAPFTIVLTVQDVNGNTDTAHAQITVFDTTAPAINIQNSAVYLDSQGVFTITPAFVDNGTWDSCGIASLSLDTTSFTCASAGDTIAAVFTALDVNGNSINDTVQLYIFDTLGPAVLTQDIDVYLDSLGEGSITEAMIDNGSWDSCGVSSYALDISNFNCGHVGNNTVTLTVTDINGNSYSDTAIVTVHDTIAPHIIASGITVYLDSFGSISITPSSLNNGTWDSCGIASIVIDSSDYSCQNIGTPVSVSITASDVNGNVSSDTVTVTILDTIAPTIQAQNITVFLDSSGNVSFDQSQIDIGTWDSCGIDSIWLSDTTFACVDSGSNMVWFIARDIHNNVDSQQVQVDVLDTLPPVVLSQNDTLYLDPNGQFTINADSIDIGSFDNCVIQATWLSDSVFTCADTGLVHQITLYAQDISGNIDSAYADIWVFDTLDPIVAVQNVTVYLDSFGSASITVSQIDNGTADNCSIDSLWLSQSDFNCAHADDTITVTLFALDVNGNLASDSAMVYVHDSTAPQPVVQNMTVALDSFGVANILPDTFDVNTWDSCGIAQLSLSDSSFTCADIGSNTLTFFAEDIHGNTSSVSVELTVVDSIAPEIVIQNLMIYLDSNGEASVTADSVNIGTWDSCGVQSIAIDTSSFTCANHGDTLSVAFTATDVNGNVSVDTSTFIILDTLPPYLFVHADTFYLDSAGQFVVDPLMLNDSTSDNCTVDSMYLSDTLFACNVVDSTFDITFYATDVFGNTDSTMVSVTFFDTIHPEIVCLDSIIVNNDTGQCGAVVNFNFPSATDNCSVDSIIQIDSTGLDSAAFFPVGFTTLSYVAYDQSGNTDTCSFVIEVQDFEAPILFCVPDTSICDTTFLFDLPAYTDNCSGLQVIQIAGIDSGAFYPVGTTVNRFAISDSYGNTDTCEFSVLRYDFPDEALAGPDQSQCEVFEATLAANQPAVGQGYWTLISGTGSVTDSTQATSTITGIEPGITTLEWRIENGVCPIERDTVTVEEYLSPTIIDAGEDQVLCDTALTTLSPTVDTLGIGSWLTPENGATIEDTSVASAFVSGLELGTYTFTWQVTNGSCPIQYDEINVDVVPYPVVEIEDDTTYIFNPSTISIEASSSLNVTYSWYPDFAVSTFKDSIAVIDVDQSTEILARGITEFGCAANDTILVMVNEALDIPTAFTPDGDNYNDVWNIKELRNYPNCEVKIYNRWGHEIFKSEGYEIPWDGTFKGEALSGGSYYFVIDLGIKRIDPLTGSITIIK